MYRENLKGDKVYSPLNMLECETGTLLVKIAKYDLADHVTSDGAIPCCHN